MATNQLRMNPGQEKLVRTKTTWDKVNDKLWTAEIFHDGHTYKMEINLCNYNGEYYSCEVDGLHCGNRTTLDRAKNCVRYFATHPWLLESKQYGEVNHSVRTLKATRDAQKQKVYDWERKVLPTVIDKARLSAKMSQTGAERLVDGCLQCMGAPILKHDGTRIVEVRHRKGERASHYSRLHNHIALASWGWQMWVIIHEAAHACEDLISKGDRYMGAHGPVYLRIYIHLLSIYFQTDVEVLTESATKYGLLVADDAMMTQNGVNINGN